MKYELTAPAGSLEICEAVIAAGADAVYLGGEKYSARAFAPNFTGPEILRALDFAHIHGRKIYLALNTLLKNRETGRELYSYIKPFYEQGLDAIIVQDYGVFQFVKRYFPELPVHISTQMSVANTYGADFLRKKGAKRIVAARELPIGEIRAIHEMTDIEIECFVHGAMCYSYSGQCLMSSLIGGRSGNRGRCAQPCRLPYTVVDEKDRIIGSDSGYPLSLKDMCAIDLLPQLCAAGATAFKIEGRMKSLAYAAGVTRIYREYLDICESDPENYEVCRSDREKLLALGNRSGFTQGYYMNAPGEGMLTMSDSSHTSGEAEGVYEPADIPRIPIEGYIVLRPGEPLTLTVSAAAKQGTIGISAADGKETGDNKLTVTVRGEAVQRAKKRPLSADEVRAHMGKTGETPFGFESLELEMEGDCFVPVGQLNELRRRALVGLQEVILRGFRRRSNDPTAVSKQLTEKDVQKYPKYEACVNADTKNVPAINVQVCTEEQLEEALAHSFVDMISLDLDAYGQYFDAKGDFSDRKYLRDVEEARARITASGKKSGFCFPFVFRSGTSDVFDAGSEGGKRTGTGENTGSEPVWETVLERFDTLWVRSIDSLGYCLSLSETGKAHIRRDRICLDAGMYVFSEEAWHDFSMLGIGGYTSSFELNGGELAHMPNRQAQFTVYGSIPVMVSAQCVYSNCASCVKNCGEETKLYLSDRFFNRFFIKRDCKDSYNVIYNSRPLCLFHRAEEIKKLGFGSLRVALTDEGRAQTAAVLGECRSAFVDGMTVLAPEDSENYTNGHFRRGVD